MVFHLIFTVIKGQAVARARAVAYLEHPSIRGPSEDSRVALLVGDQRALGSTLHSVAGCGGPWGHMRLQIKWEGRVP